MAEDFGRLAKERAQGIEAGKEYGEGAYSDTMDYGTPEHPQAQKHLRGEEDDRPGASDSVFERYSQE